MELGVGGKIHGIGLSSFLQMVQMEKTSCTLKVSSHNNIGRLYLLDGNLIDAETNTKKELDAAYDIIGWEDSLIEIENHQKDRKKVINIPLMSLLMEGLRRKDEKKPEPENDSQEEKEPELEFDLDPNLTIDDYEDDDDFDLFDINKDTSIHAKDIGKEGETKKELYLIEKNLTKKNYWLVIEHAKKLGVIDNTLSKETKDLIEKAEAQRRDRFLLYYKKISTGQDPIVGTQLRKIANKIIDQLKNSDFKKARVILDSLDLPRSSIVKLAIQKIFRDSEDEQDLIDIISQECSKIVNSIEEIKNLRKLKEKDLSSLMNNIVTLMWEDVVKKHMIGSWATISHGCESMEDSEYNKVVEAAFEQLKNTDSKSIRQGLDGLGLQRASLLRMSLQRISRNSMDIKELKNTTKEEAGILSNSEELEALWKLKEKDKTPFISNIIYILWEEVTKRHMEKSWEILYN
ncbi:MAG: DUF4388 domain-containing protein [Desulfobacterales bacterium]|nr:DUF4388 domain-containing protein [Desulfobacterales bacterium]